MGPPAVAPATTHAASPRRHEGARLVGHRGAGAGVVQRRGATLGRRAINLGRRGDNDRGEDVAKHTGSTTDAGGLLRVVSQPVADTVATNPVVGLGLTAAVGVAAAVAASARRGGDDHHRAHDAARAATSTAAASRDDHVTFSFDDAVDVPPAAPNAVHAGDDDPSRDPRPNKPPPFPSLPDRSKEDASVVVQQTPAAPRDDDVPTTAHASVASEEDARFEAALASGGRSTDAATEDARAALRAWKKTVGDDTAVVDPRADRSNVAGSIPIPRGGKHERRVPVGKDLAREPGARNNNPWWDVDIDDAPYPAAPQKSKSKPRASDAKRSERRRAARRKNRESYLRNNQSVRRGSPGDRARAAELVRQRLRPIGGDGSSFEAEAEASRGCFSRVFDSRTVGAAAYGVALAALCREHALDAVAGEGTFSDVYATRRTEGGAEGGAEGDAEGDASRSSFGTWRSGPDDVDRALRGRCFAPIGVPAVLKCSVPFPGVIQGRRVGDGLAIGEVEARVLAEIPPHPNVVRLLAAFLSDERNESYLLLGDAGDNLHAARERGEVSPRDVRRHARSVLRALAHVHAHGVVHRDVKGGNILVGKDGAATLIDFGVARHHSVPDQFPAARYGTPGYQAPELLMTDMRAAERDWKTYQKVDAFAMGCTLFFLCTGRELYGAGSGAGGDDGDDCGARTKTKNRAMRAQTLVDGAMDGGDGFGANGVDGTRASAENRNQSPPDGEDALSFGAKAAALSPALGGLLRARASAAAVEDDRRELDVDWKMLASMAEFPGYEPRTAEEISYVQEQYGASSPGDATIRAAPAYRESLESFVERKLCPRQPRGFAALVAAMLARDPRDRPDAEQALAWPGAWEELDPAEE